MTRKRSKGWLRNKQRLVDLIEMAWQAANEADLGQPLVRVDPETRNAILSDIRMVTYTTVLGQLLPKASIVRYKEPPPEFPTAFNKD